jgi:hypothetical protein
MMFMALLNVTQTVAVFSEEPQLWSNLSQKPEFTALQRFNITVTATAKLKSCVWSADGLVMGGVVLGHAAT